MTMFAPYDASKVFFNFGPIIATGLAPGSFVKITRSADAFEDEVGAGGDLSRSRKNDDRSNVTLNLMKNSPTNAALSAVHKVDKATGAGIFPLGVTDLLGGQLSIAPKAWILKYADIEYGEMAGTREWTFRAVGLEDLP